MRHFFLLLLLVLAAATGFLLGIYRHYKTIGKLSPDTAFVDFLLDEGAAAKRSGEPEKTDLPVTGEQGKPPEVVKAEKENEPSKQEMTDEEKLAALKESASKEFSLARFKEAEQHYLEIEELAAKTLGADSPQAVEAGRLKLRSRVFAAVVAAIPVDSFKGDENLIEIKLAGKPKPFFASIIAKADDTYTVKKESGIEAIYPMSQVSLTGVPAEKYTLLRRGELDSRLAFLAGKADASYSDYFRCAVYAVHYGLSESVTGLMEKTFSASGAENLLEKHVLGSGLELVSLLLRSYGRDAEADAYEVLAARKKSEAQPGTGDPLKTQEWTVADKMYEAGFGAWMTSFPGDPDYLKNIETAEKHLRDAREMLLDIVQRFPESGEASRKLVDTNAKLFSVIARMPFPEATASEVKKPAAIPDPLPEDPLETADFKAAKGEFEKGCESFRMAKQGTSDYVKFLQEAELAVTRAQLGLQKLLELYPDNPEIKKLSDEIARKLDEIDAAKSSEEKTENK